MTYITDINNGVTDMNSRKYTVVENAGYESETDIRSFDHYRDACAFIDRIYETGEAESLHVSIRMDKSNGEQTYDF